MYSLGLERAGEDGQVSDVADGSPAASAAIGDGTKIVAVGGCMFSRDAAGAALTAAMHGRAPLQVITAADNVFVVRGVDDHGGPRSPHLVRAGGGPDRLAAIVAPHRPAPFHR